MNKQPSPPKARQTTHRTDGERLYRLWPTGAAWRERHDAREGERVELPEDGIDINLPAFPGLPGPMPSPAPGAAPARYDLYPRGPYDVADPTPWDPYVYPAAPRPPELPPVTRAERAALSWLYDWWRGEQERRARDRERLPNDDKPLLPASVLSAPSLPSGVGLIDALSTREGQTSKGFFSASPLDLLDDFLKRAGIRHIKAHEITPHRWRHVKGIKRLTLPPVGMRIAAWSHTFDLIPPDAPVWLILPRYVVPDPDLWPNILPPLRVVDRFREWLGSSVTGISGYRCPWYNAQIEGAKDSRHMRFAGLDFTYGVRDGLGHLDTGVFKRWFEHLYRGPADGLGRYDGFIHLDINTRPRGSGKALNWDKRTNKR